MDRIEDNMLSVRTSLIPLMVQTGINQVHIFALWTQFCSLE